jgi:serine/threonine protein kinase
MAERFASEASPTMRLSPLVLGSAGFPGVLPESANLAPEAREFLRYLLEVRLLAPVAVPAFLERHAHDLGGLTSAESLGQVLVEEGLLTGYQFDRVQSGNTHGLVLGSYRVLDRLGLGSMGVVFLAEHALMKRRAAVKVLPVNGDYPADLLERFYGEIRVLADLHHSNIVMAYDAGEVPAAGPRMPPLVYLVMELVPGGDLEKHVRLHGPAGVGQACAWIRQAACGLQEAHHHAVIHRDIKPSNLLLTARGQVKVVDFGLVRHLSSRLTNPRALLGTVEFMAPEQSLDPSKVGAEADTYGLGASLLWLLTGETPYPPAATVAAALKALQHDRPRRLRELRPGTPEDLDALINRMLDPEPTSRPAPAAVMEVLAPYAGDSPP